jgi:hypothetical protein
MANENSTRLWVNGYILLGQKTRIEVEEVSVDLSRDLKEHYNSGISKPNALIPGQEKIDFKIKRIFSDVTLAKIYEKRCSFSMILFNNSSDPGNNTTGEQVCALSGCMLSKESLSGLGRGDAVTEDVDGKALDITWNITEIAKMINPACANL